MPDGQDSRSGSGGLLRTITAVTALLTAIGGLVGALAAAGVFDDDGEASGDTVPTTGAPTTAPATPATAAPTTAPPTTASTSGAAAQTAPQQLASADRVAVTLAYAGDLEGCSVNIAVDIGDRSFLPIGNSFVAADVEAGSQLYAIGGVILCPLSGQCQAAGDGIIDVAAGRTYFVEWFNADFGVCQVELVEV